MKIELLRPYQWVKNLFVLLPVFFGQQLLNQGALLHGVLAWVAFSLAASGIYCLNDLCDVESDRRHPQKCRRPIASGRVSCRSARTMMVVCWLLAVGAGVVAHATLPLLGYICLQIAYCLWLKHIPFVDIVVIATGFVLRVLAGGEATGISVSGWLMTMTLLLTLFIALGKRRDDVAVYRQTGQKPRRIVDSYRMPVVNVATAVLACAIITVYVLYTLSDDVTSRLHYVHLWTTALWVVAAMLRYLWLISGHTALAYSPTRLLLTDRILGACLLGWGCHFAYILYIA